MATHEMLVTRGGNLREHARHIREREGDVCHSPSPRMGLSGAARPEGPYAAAAAVLLAGGKSARMGTDKLRIDVGGHTLIESLSAAFAKAFQTVWISVARASDHPGIPLEHVADRFPGAGPMAGLEAALTRLAGAPEIPGTPCRTTFLCAGDMPFANPAAAVRICEAGTEADICVLVDAEGRAEPLFACYSKNVLPVIRTLLADGDYRMSSILEGAVRRGLSVMRLSPDDPRLAIGSHLLLNVNTPEDLRNYRENYRKCDRTPHNTKSTNPTSK